MAYLACQCMTPDYNNIASSYDFLKKIIFGKTLDRAEQSLLVNIPKKSTILILGGGSGNVLHHLPEDCKIVYVELSSRMIDIVKRKNVRQSITYIQHDAIDYLAGSDSLNFDVVITSFFLDQYESEQIRQIAKSIKEKSSKDIQWLITDFQINENLSAWRKLKHKLLVTVMYLFFYLATGLKTQKLPEIRKDVRSCGFKEKQLYDSKNCLVFSAVYQLY